MKRYYLSETIDYEQDIEPYPFIGIYSGVGSGKNFFIDCLALGHIPGTEAGQCQEFRPQTILLITSRRAKVNELRNNTELMQDQWIGQWDDAPSWYLDDREDARDIWLHRRKVNCEGDAWCQGTRTIYQRTVVCTNAAIEHYQRNNYNPADSTTFLWNRFDIIVFDEAHSLLADMSYQTAPFYSLSLLEEVLEYQKNGDTKCKIIMMTGTPRILQNLSISDDCHLIDRMDQCHHVTPERVIFTEKKPAREEAAKMLFNGERAVLFFNHVGELLEYYAALEEEFPSFLDQVAYSFSDEKRRKDIGQNKLTEFDKMVETEKYIAENMAIPERITLFLTTARNKEGINICNGDIRTMFVEAHDEVSVLQMVGRLRDGVDRLFVVTNSKGYPNKESPFEYLTADESVSQFCDDRLRLFCKNNKVDIENPLYLPLSQYPDIVEFIEFLESKNAYLQFNYSENRFQLNNYRKICKDYYAKQNAIFAQAKRSQKGLVELAHKWYPNTKVTVHNIFTDQVTEYLKEHDILDKEISRTQQQECLAFLNYISGKSGKTLSPALKTYGYIFKPKNKNTGCPGTIQKIA